MKNSYNEWNAKSVKNMLNKCGDLRREFILTENYNGASGVVFTSNRKLNGVVSFGTLPVIDCGKCCKNCVGGCYALRHLLLYPSKRVQLAWNSARLANNRDKFFEDIEKAARLAIAFRWHESGEIADYDYFCRLVSVVNNTPNCLHLVMTKNHAAVNRWISEKGSLPENLHLLLSCWYSVDEAKNTYNLPVTLVDFSESPGKYKKPLQAGDYRIKRCGGDCSQCFINRGGCFGAKSGDCVVFKAH